MIGQAQASEEARAYLRELYTNVVGDMYCQACHALLPFKVKGSWYFQAVQFIGGRKHVHRQNVLALCPLCAALYRHKRETTDESLLAEFLSIDLAPGQGIVDVPVPLNGESVRILFTGKHALDLQAALAAAGDGRSAST